LQGSCAILIEAKPAAGLQLGTRYCVLGTTFKEGTMTSLRDMYQREMAPWPALAPYSRLIDLPGAGLSLHLYDSQTQGKPGLILLHGLGDEADTWRYVFEPLSAGFRVVAIDLPGFGRSEDLPGPYSIPALAGLLLELMDRLGLPASALAGSSMGAVIAHWLALEHPDRVARLVLLDGALLSPAARLNPLLLLFLIPGIGEMLYTRLRRHPQAAYDTLAPYYADLAAMPETDRGFLFQRVNERVWSDRQRRAYFRLLRGAGAWTARQQSSLAGRLATLAVPTLVLWGEHDRIMPVGNAQAVIAAQPSARLAIIAGVGHLPHQEQPAETLREMSAFLGVSG
jgi:pimeloyl-ACP methyl ester carboxylesterase